MVCIDQQVNWTPSLGPVVLFPCRTLVDPGWKDLQDVRWRSATPPALMTAAMTLRLFIVFLICSDVGGGSKPALKLDLQDKAQPFWVTSSEKFAQYF